MEHHGDTATPAESAVKGIHPMKDARIREVVRRTAMELQRRTPYPPCEKKVKADITGIENNNIIIYLFNCRII